MKRIVTTAVLTLGLSATGTTGALASSLHELESACRAGNHIACSQYNAAVMGQAPVVAQGYDPFAMVPATYADTTPKAPSGEAGNTAAAKTDATAIAVQIVQ